LERSFHRTAIDVQVLVESQRPEGEALGEVVLVHGLEGSGAAGYMRSMSAAALRAGFAVHRFHMRTCGGTERLCRTLYHAGLTSDLASFIHHLRSATAMPLFVVGCSLGGNVVLKLSGELGQEARGVIAGVCAVSAPIDLEACAERIAAPQNRIYERRFVRRMRARLAATGRYSRRDFAGLHSVMDFDEKITAPSFGFGGARHYYQSQSAIRYLERICIPALLVQAKDDTFIPFEVFNSPAVRSNRWIELLATEHGGHLGFIGRKPLRFWADDAIMDWITRTRVQECNNPRNLFPCEPPAG
jgi:uncharacterized protein